MIYSKLDWYTVVVNDVSIAYCLEKLGFDLSFYEDFFNNGHEMSVGNLTYWCCNLNGVNLFLDLDDYLCNGDKDGFIDMIFSDIRVDITGKGLDFLRQRGFAVDKVFRDRGFWDCQYHTTRADFAFDFVNYNDTILFDLRNYLIEVSSKFFLKGKTPRLPTGNSTSAVKFSLRDGKDRTIYFGSTGSERLLRCYDKKYEFFPDGVVLPKKLPPAWSQEDKDLRSWIRFELQVRKKKSQELLFNSLDDKFEDVLRVIHDWYRFYDSDTKEPVKVWQDFMNWEKFPKLQAYGQNFYFVQSRAKQAEQYIEITALRQLLSYFAIYGVSGSLRRLNTVLRNKYTSTSRKSQLSVMGISHSLSLLCDELDLDPSSLFDDVHFAKDSFKGLPLIPDLLSYPDFGREVYNSAEVQGSAGLRRYFVARCGLDRQQLLTVCHHFMNLYYELCESLGGDSDE